MTEKLSLDEVKSWIFRFCFGRNSEEWSEPPACPYGENLICKLVSDPKDKEPADYCPLINFMEWLKTHLEEENCVLVKGSRYSSPEALLDNVAHHGGKVFDPLTFWQIFNRRENMKVLTEVLIHVDDHPTDTLYEVNYDGVVNVVDHTHILALPFDVEVKADSVKWMERIDAQQLEDMLAELVGGTR